MMLSKQVQKSLFELQDLKYRDFHARLIPNVCKETIIGVRTPQLRRFAKEFSKQTEAKVFMKDLPHDFYEENNLHGFLIEQIQSYPTCIEELDRFLPYVNNWATCDSIRPKCFPKHLPELLDKIKQWLGSGHTYTVRFAIEMLMTFYLDEHFSSIHLQMVAELRSDAYYINMMIAWYFATALAKQYEDALPYIEQGKLDVWTHNKAIQKAVESYRITAEQKTHFKTLKMHGVMGSHSITAR